MRRLLCFSVLAAGLMTLLGTATIVDAQQLTVGRGGIQYNTYGRGAYGGYGGGYNRPPYSTYGHGPYGYGGGNVYHSHGGYGYGQPHYNGYGNGYGASGYYSQGPVHHTYGTGVHNSYGRGW